MKAWSSVALLLVLAGHVAADVPAPRPKPAPAPAPNPNAVNFVIQVDDKATEAKLVVPKQFMGVKGRADLGNGDGTMAGVSKFHTVVAGLCLTLALSFGGLWLMRHRGKYVGRALGLLLGTAGFLAISAAVWANRAPLPVPAPPVMPVPVNGKVLVEVVEQGDAVRLILTREQRNQLFGQVIPQPVPPIRPLPPKPAVPPVPAPGGGIQAVPPVEPPVPVPLPVKPEDR